MANNSAAAKALKKISKIALKKTGWQEAGGIKSKEQEQKGKEGKEERDQSCGSCFL